MKLVIVVLLVAIFWQQYDHIMIKNMYIFHMPSFWKYLVSSYSVCKSSCHSYNTISSDDFSSPIDVSEMNWMARHG